MATTGRRAFLGTIGGVAMATVLPRNVLSGPNGKINIAGIGAGGRGRADIGGVKGENIVALCDVDARQAAGTFKKFPKAKRFRDFRKMLDAMDKQIDAVVVATPDHTHAVAAMAGITRGRHVYCEKPLAHSVHEVRELMKAARKHEVVTQLGNQGHSSNHMRLVREWVQDGAIGEVSEIHAACGSNYSRIADLPRLKEKHPVPPQVDWDLWLGPAKYIPYHPALMPRNWRGWMPFGTGVVGDWVCHVADPSFWALDLGAPQTIQADVRGYEPEKHALCYPPGAKISYEFPAKGKRGPVRLVWFDGQWGLPRPAELVV